MRTTVSHIIRHSSSSIAQSVERRTVNHPVTPSRDTLGQAGGDELVEPHRVNRRIDMANQYRHVGPAVASDAKSPKRVTCIHGVR